MLATGEKDWHNYTATVRLQLLSTVEPCGLLFRYQTSLSHYGFFIGAGKAQLIRVEGYSRRVLALIDFEAGCDRFYERCVTCRGGRFACFVDGQKALEAVEYGLERGCVAIAAFMPARFASVQVECDEAEQRALLKERAQRNTELDARRQRYFGMKLHKVINLKDFGAGRQIRFGHLTGTKELFFVMAQNQKRVYQDRYGTISCLTAVSMESGKILWQIGTPVAGGENSFLTADLPMQVYDIDADGVDEVIIGHDFKIKILDGRTGEVKKWVHTPFNDDPADQICGIEFNKHAFDRLNIDAIIILNAGGKERASEF